MEEAMSSRDGGPLLTIPPGPPTSAIIARLEREVRELWVGLPGELPKSRVCMMNLVVAVTSRAIADRYTTVVDEVTATLPSCAIIVALESAAPTRPLNGSATAVCTPGSGGAVCSERIRLDACGSVCARVASAVEALIAPEVPTTLVWLGPVRAGDEVFTSMAENAERVILDSEYTSATSLLELARWSREEEGRPAFADMAWTRISPWQNLCARFFDDPRTEHAGAITRVTIHQASEAGAPLGSEGALLLGWLANRLGWRADRSGGALRVRREDGQEVQVQVRAVPRPEGVAPLALASLTVESSTGGVALKGTIDRELASGVEMSGKTPDADILTWRLDVSGQAVIEQRVRLRANKGARVLERTLHRPVVDPVLVEAVEFAAHFFEDRVAIRPTFT
jgi:glucose-6-phosphate dehydrogenase assembly protein OpcA